MLVFAVVMIVVHTIGTPAIYAFLFFWKHKGVLDALKEQVRVRVRVGVRVRVSLDALCLCGSEARMTNIAYSKCRLTDLDWT